ncbi:MAG: sulfurase, partial [Pseudorhodobacter sp.]|nr:sulfurase [Pseudorhodobacter sp.]
ENLPCTLPARVIENRHPEKGRTFKPAARMRRGVTAWVEREGTLRVGDSVTVYIPNQRAWRGA